MRKALEKHIKEHIKEYVIFGLILIIGLFIGTMVLNNSSNDQREEISGYLNGFNTQIKEGSKIEYSKMIFELIKKDLKLLIENNIIITIGFCIGYTISAISAIFGIGKGMIFSFSLMFLSKIIEIPAIFFLALSGIKMYKTIIKDRSKENIKYAITKYAINMLISTIMLVVAAFIETYLSTNLYLSIAKYV